MQLDIRLPMGLMFAILGLLLSVFGVIMGASERSLNYNINLWWGLVLLGFGVILFLMGRRGTSAMHPSNKSLEEPKRPH